MTSSKRVQIDKAKTRSVGIIAFTVFVTVFSLVSANSLLKQRNYQAKVIGKKEAANKQLEDNIAATTTLVASYKQFVGSPVNMLGGNPAGTGEKDGDNARLVLDALPSKYDFPALASSFEKILTERGFTNSVIGGSDDEVAQATAKETATPVLTTVPFQLSVDGSYTSIQDLVSVFERSIRPISVQKITLDGGTNAMTMNVELNTFVQSAKKLDIKMETVN